MNGVSHYAFSIIITLLLGRTITTDDTKRKYMGYFLIFVINFYFHVFVDSLSDLTYHPSNASWGDLYFTAWHIFIYSCEAVLGIIVLRRDLRYTIGLVGSVGFDIWDWSIGRYLSKHYDITIPRLHNIADWVNDTLFFWLPKLRNEEWASITEIIIVGILLVYWIRKRSEFEENSQPGSWLQITLLVLFFGFWRVLTFF